MTLAINDNKISMGELQDAFGEYMPIAALAAITFSKSPRELRQQLNEVLGSIRTKDIVERLREIDFSNDFVQFSPILTVQQAANEIEWLRERLERIARMKVFPDDKINRTTLAAAIYIASGKAP